MADVLTTLLAPLHAQADALAPQLADANSVADLQRARQQWLGKKGTLGQIQRQLGELAPELRKEASARLQAERARIEAAFDARGAVLAAAERERALARGRADVTRPGRRTLSGAPHPIRLMEARVLEVMCALGFRIAEGPLVEHDWFNFEALNIPSDHPARDMQDTFFVTPEVVLRTHTSNVQIRTMMHEAPPVRVVAPGMVFRHDDIDATHTPVFHQVEGLWIDERASFADLKGVLRALLVHLFGPEAEPRFRPSFFPFTEPSAEVDVSCIGCARRGAKARAGCRICKGTGWLEVLGAGMVDPAVLQAVGYDPERVQGFAFGAGLERLALLYYGIEDIRLLYDNDQRFLQQFAPRPGIAPASGR